MEEIPEMLRDQRKSLGLLKEPNVATPDGSGRGTSCSTIDNDVASSSWSNHVLSWMCVEDTFCNSHLSIRNMSMHEKVGLCINLADDDNVSTFIFQKLFPKLERENVFEWQ